MPSVLSLIMPSSCFIAAAGEPTFPCSLIVCIWPPDNQEYCNPYFVDLILNMRTTGGIKMASAKMLTDTEIERRLTAARDAERKARARIARLKRASFGAARRIDTQRKCALGGVLLALAGRDAEADRRLVAYVRAYMREHPPHESNQDALRGTAFAVDVEVPRHE
jgi:hypothetical protein